MTRHPGEYWVYNRPSKGANIHYPGGGGGVEFLSPGNYLFQPGSAARWKFNFSKLFISRGPPEILYFKKNPAPTGNRMVAP